LTEKVEEFNENLLKDEKILWCTKKTVNLVNFIRLGVFLIMFFIILYKLFFYYYMIQGNFFSLMFLIPTLTLGTLTVSLILLKEYKKLSKLLGLSYKQLKYYNYYNILTNKRYIRKNFKLNHKTDFSVYPVDVVEIINYTIFLNYEKIERVVLNLNRKIIDFKIKGFTGISNAEFYLEYSKNDLNEIMRVLINTLKLVKKQETSKYIEYVRLII